MCGASHVGVTLKSATERSVRGAANAVPVCVDAPFAIGPASLSLYGDAAVGRPVHRLTDETLHDLFRFHLVYARGAVSVYLHHVSARNHVA